MYLQIQYGIVSHRFTCMHEPFNSIRHIKIFDTINAFSNLIYIAADNQSNQLKNYNLFGNDFKSGRINDLLASSPSSFSRE